MNELALLYNFYPCVKGRPHIKHFIYLPTFSMCSSYVTKQTGTYTMSRVLGYLSYYLPCTLWEHMGNLYYELDYCPRREHGGSSSSFPLSFEITSAKGTIWSYPDYTFGFDSSTFYF